MNKVNQCLGENGFDVKPRDLLLEGLWLKCLAILIVTGYSSNKRISGIRIAYYIAETDHVEQKTKSQISFAPSSFHLQNCFIVRKY